MVAQHVTRYVHTNIQNMGKVTPFRRLPPVCCAGLTENGNDAPIQTATSSIVEATAVLTP